MDTQESDLRIVNNMAWTIDRLTDSLKEANLIAAQEMDKNLVLEDRVYHLEERLEEQATQIRGCPQCGQGGI